jgi:hypothetical protein
MKTFRFFRRTSHHTPHGLQSLHVDLTAIIIQHGKNSTHDSTKRIDVFTNYN